MPPENDGTGNEGTELESGQQQQQADGGQATGADEKQGDPGAQKGNAGGDGGSEAAGKDAFAELDKDTRDWVMKRHDGDVTKLARQARELDRLMGKSVQVPGENADQSEWDKFYEKIGRPAGTSDEALQKYGFEPPEDLPETMPYDAERDGKFAQKAFELGLSTQQAQGLREWFIEDQKASATSVEDQIKESVSGLVEASKAELTKLYGPMEGERFKAQMELADRFFRAVDTSGKLQEKLQKLGMLGPNKEVLDADLAIAFANGGSALYAEDGKVSGDASLVGNPYEDGAGFNLTQAMQLAKNDPDRARTLIVAAGKRPEEFGLSS